MSKKKQASQVPSPLPAGAGGVDAVVPVAGADQRQAVGAHPVHGVADGAAAMVVDVARLARRARRQQEVHGAVRHRGAVEIGLALVEHRPVARGLDVAGQHVGEPQMRVGGAGALAEADAAVVGEVPPLEHVALGELHARVDDDLPARQRGIEEQQRQHVLQLVAEAEGAPALVRPGAAPEARGEALVGEPVVDEAVEGGIVGLDPDGADALGPPGLGGLQRRAGGRGVAQVRGGGQGLALRGELAQHHRHVDGAARRHRHLAREGGDAAAVVGLLRIRPAGLDHHRGREVAPRRADEARPHRLGHGGGEARRHEGPAGLEVVVRVLEEQGFRALVAPGVEQAEAVAGALVEGDLHEGHHAVALRRRPVVADRQDADIGRRVGEDEDRHRQFEVAAAVGEGGGAEPVFDAVDRVRPAERHEAGGIGLAGGEVDHRDRLPRLQGRAGLEAEGRDRVLPLVALEGVDLALVRHHGAEARGVGQHMGPGARRRGRQQEARVALEAERPGRGRRDRAGVDQPLAAQQRPERGLVGRRTAEGAGDRPRGVPLVRGAAGDQPDLGAGLGGDLEAHRQGGGGVEGVERTLVVDRAPALGSEAARVAQARRGR